MSRKCPKRNNSFFSWLKANRYRFTHEIQVTRIKKRHISFRILGVTPVLKFGLRITPSNGPWFSVDALMPGQDLEGLKRIFAAEKQTSEGWITLRQPPENRRFWRTREELWKELCFEPFLEWCNRELTKDSWLVRYEGFGTSNVSIHRNEALAKASIPSWEKTIIEVLQIDKSNIEKLTSEAKYLMVPLFQLIA